ncbi:probable WRKY transcription factor 17 [Solanum lycopersicum]|uniref:WRKY domain-containing protein n=2 Tax=Solanum lycopersicum TaxID=4081 RepID=A0A3Q7JEK4_SOLLC|nr:probable WRKY transcription factor 17 [Solanum lycopersicum]
MAVLSKMNESFAVEEAASAGLKSMENLIRLVSHEPVQADCREMADFTVSKFKKVISILDRTGHARFRRGPVQAQAPAPVQVRAPVRGPVYPDSFTSLSLAPSLSFATAKERLAPSLSFASAKERPVVQVQTALTLDFSKLNVNRPIGNSSAFTAFTVKSKEVLMADPTPTNSSSFMSTITGEATVSNGKQVSSSMLLLPPQAVNFPTTGKRCREHEQSDAISGSKSTGSGKCHCKKRKAKDRKVIRIPAISTRVADIPGDEFSWRKYGQKPIKGSKYPRGYYKCSSLRGCPARKHVERAMDDPTMLIVTYEDEHCHNPVAAMHGNSSQMVNFGLMEKK